MKIMKMGQTLSEREKKKNIMCIDLWAFHEKNKFFPADTKDYYGLQMKGKYFCLHNQKIVWRQCLTNILWVNPSRDFH